MKRFITGLVAALIFILAIYLRGWALRLLLMICAGGCTLEVAFALKKGGVRPQWILPLIFTLGFCALPPVKDYATGWALMGLLVPCALMTFIFRKNVELKDVLASGFLFVYPGLSFMLSALVISHLGETDAILLILIAVLIAISTDIAAYFGGSRFGKHKLCPHISPKKTVEGALFGILGCVVAVSVALFGLRNQLPIPYVLYPVIGIVGSAFAQCGDLTASLIKRACGIKDYGKILPGHGGLTDRLDSIIFSLGAVCAYALLLLK